ncbi:hypothetical protein PVAP13_2NG070700 [Panicum virgatum]|uniref:GRF-type domain-containing protein n=1 Tax=Panicum virgatum TaxID=38727 RepID=A0A8T0VCW0_PANVG|nr:hypothetical protein PVAP13_2NG070700 [Panicum virgatum]
MCPYCKDLRLVAFTCKWTKNRGKRFFICPRYNELEENRCGFYMFQNKYEHYLETKGYLEHCRTNVDMDGVHEVEAIEQVREGLHDLKEEM